VDMRTVIAEKLAAGESENEILRYFVDRYGAAILREPPTSGFFLAVWLVPMAALLAGGLALAAILRPFVARGSAAPAARPGPVQDLLDEREALLQGVRELESDRSLGNLGDDEYRRLRAGYDSQLASVRSALDGRANGLAADLEAEIALERRRHDR